MAYSLLIELDLFDFAHPLQFLQLLSPSFLIVGPPLLCPFLLAPLDLESLLLLGA